MASSTRIPRGIVSFNDYICLIVVYLKAGGTETNSQRLSIGDDEVKFLSDLLDAWNVLYPKYSDKKSGRTTAVIDQLYELIDNMVGFDQDHHLLDRIASSRNAVLLDFETFNIRKGTLQKTTSKTQTKSISELVQPLLEVIGGGVVSAKCYSNESSRPGIFSQSNSVQYVYVVGNTPPASPIDDSLEMGLSTRGSFNLSLGADKAGKVLYIYFRWYSTVHAEIAGPWSNLQTVWLT